MTHVVRLTGPAETSLDHMVRDLEASSGALPVAWYRRILAATNSLSFLPERCHRAAEADDLGIDLRELIVGRRRGTVRVLFTVTAAVVTVQHFRWAIRGPVRPEDLA